MNHTPEPTPPFKHRLVCQLVIFTQKLSFKNAWRLSGVLAWLFYPFKNALTTTIIENLTKVYPDATGQEIQQLAKESFRHTIAFALEAGSVWLKPLDYGIRHITQIHGLELFKEAQASGDGVLFLLPHLGNWEMANQFIAPRADVVALYKPHPNKQLEHYIFTARTRAGVTMVPTDRTGVSKILRHLKSGGVTVVLPDQVPDAKGGVMANFFQQAAATTTLVPKLAKSSKSRLLGLVCARNEQGGFEVHITQAPITIADQDIQLATTSMNAYIESLVARFPTQYQWSYKRFKASKITQEQESTTA